MEYNGTTKLKLVKSQIALLSFATKAYKNSKRYVFMNHSESAETMLTSNKALDMYSVHAAYGSAMLTAHSLELSFKTLLKFFVIDKNEKQETKSKLQKIEKMTLGMLIAELCKHIDFGDYWEDEFDNCLFFRNQLTHNIADDIISASISSGNNEKFINNLAEIKSYFIEAQSYVDKKSFELLDKQGISKKQFEIILENYISLLSKT